MLPMTASVDQWIYERYRELPDLSPSTAKRDRVDKLHIYRKAGVRRYLLVDVQARTLEVLLLEGDSYLVEASLGPEDSYDLTDYGVTLKMADLFKDIPVE